VKPSTLDLLAERVADKVFARLAELLPEPDDVAEPLVDASEVAERYGTSRGWVYENAHLLGAIRLGEGPKARLRFDPQTVFERLAPRPAPVTKPPTPRPRRQSAGAELLPVRDTTSTTSAPPSLGAERRGGLRPPGPASR
jgi:hypothetical protein